MTDDTIAKLTTCRAYIVQVEAERDKAYKQLGEMSARIETDAKLLDEARKLCDAANRVVDALKPAEVGESAWDRLVGQYQKACEDRDRLAKLETEPSDALRLRGAEDRAEAAERERDETIKDATTLMGRNDRLLGENSKLTARLATLEAAARTLNSLVAEAQNLCRMYLEPGECRVQTKEQLADSIIGLLNGPFQRKAQGLLRAALDEQPEGLASRTTTLQRWYDTKAKNEPDIDFTAGVPDGLPPALPGLSSLDDIEAQTERLEYRRRISQCFATYPQPHEGPMQHLVSLVGIIVTEAEARVREEISKMPAFAALSNRAQADADGVMVKVSRQALDEVLAAIRAGGQGDAD